MTYAGQWKENTRNGYGTLTYPPGHLLCSYAGQWKDGLENGLGKLISKDELGIVFEGEFKDGKIWAVPQQPSVSAGLVEDASSTTVAAFRSGLQRAAASTDDVDDYVEKLAFFFSRFHPLDDEGMPKLQSMIEAGALRRKRHDE